jgi:hypothetical protein
MIQILLVHNKFEAKEPLTYLSYAIRVGSCSKWNHCAIRIDDRVIEAIGTGVTISSYDEWFSRSNRIVLPKTPRKSVQLYLDEVLFTEKESYGFLDLLERLKEIKTERWDGKEFVENKDYKGLICSDLVCILLGLPKKYIPADFEYRFNNLLYSEEEYITTKINPELTNNVRLSSQHSTESNVS